MRIATIGRRLLATLFFLVGTALVGASALTVYFRDPMKTTLVLVCSGAAGIAAAVWLFRRR